MIDGKWRDENENENENKTHTTNNAHDIQNKNKQIDRKIINFFKIFFVWCNLTRIERMEFSFD